MASDVVIGQDMEKDNAIQIRFDRYFAGAELPPYDLSKAKRVVSARSRSRVRKTIAAVASFAAVGACMIVGMVMLFNNIFGGLWNELPEESGTHGYFIAEASSSSASFSELNGKYALMHGFAPFSLASNADAQYTLYYEDDREVLLRADLRYTDGFTSFRATVWCDLTEGEYSPKDFEDYRALVPEGETYGSETEYIGGEYVSRACMMKGDTEFVIDMTSPQNTSLNKLVSMLKK